MVSPAGRGIRIAAGLILIALGAFMKAGEINWVMIGIGVIPLAAGMFDFCLIAPLFGYYFSGPKTRNAVNPPKPTA